MASDEDYKSFLERLHMDPAQGSAWGHKFGWTKVVQLKMLDEVPWALMEGMEQGKWMYESGTDAEFVPVALRLSMGGFPDEETLAKLIKHLDPSGATIEILDPTTWVGGRYMEVVEAMTMACPRGDVRVYKIGIGGARCEYWVLGVDKVMGRLMGMKAKAVET